MIFLPQRQHRKEHAMEREGRKTGCCGDRLVAPCPDTDRIHQKNSCQSQNGRDPGNFLTMIFFGKPIANLKSGDRVVDRTEEKRRQTRDIKYEF